jgi:MOSC domain-containing protein YiiM
MADPLLPVAAAVVGRLASLHLHPAKSGLPFLSVETVEAVADRGLRGDQRYFGRRRRGTKEPTLRQVTLIERETLARHARTLGIAELPPGSARSNLETEGIVLADWIGRRVRVGTALLEFVEPRMPCAKMDALHPGLRALMAPPAQGVLARVLESGVLRIGDAIRVED